MGITDGLRRKLVEIRRLDPRVAVRADRTVALVVGQDSNAGRAVEIICRRECYAVECRIDIRYAAAEFDDRIVSKYGGQTALGQIRDTGGRKKRSSRTA